MKNLGYILLAFFLFTASINAQDFGDIMELANDTFGEGEEAETGSWEDVKKAIDKKLEDPKIKEMMRNFSYAFNKFADETQTGKCLQLMGAYAEMLAYCDMKAETEADPCKRKDWYGIESMILFMGTSISYCPQEFYGIANFDDPDEDEQIKIVSQYEAEINVYFFGDYLKYFTPSKMELSEDDIATIYNENYSKSSEYVHWNELEESLKKRFIEVVRTIQEGDFYDYVDDDPHLKLYVTFFQANEQLDLLEKEEDGETKVGFVIDFVSKMFTPEYQIKKALEIASESSTLKCNK